MSLIWAQSVLDLSNNHRINIVRIIPSRQKKAFRAKREMIYENLSSRYQIYAVLGKCVILDVIDEFFLELELLSHWRLWSTTETLVTILIFQTSIYNPRNRDQSTFK